MAPTQSKISNSNGVTSLAVSFDSLPATSRRLVVFAGVWEQAEALTLTCADNQGHTYNEMWRLNPGGSTSGYAAWDVVVSSSSGTFTITVSTDGTSADLCVCIVELPMGSRDTFERDSGETAAALTISKGLTTTQAETELLGFMIPNWIANPANVTESGSFTLLREQTNNSTAVGMYVSTRTVSSTGTYTCTWTWDDASNHSGAASIGAWYGAVGGGSQPPFARPAFVAGMKQGFGGQHGIR